VKAINWSSNSPAVPWLVLAGSLLVLFGVWHWATGVAASSNARMILANKLPLGNNSDLYPRWLGARELLLHGRDPYSDDVTREIQAGFYGRPLDPRNPSDPIAQESFVYPLYVVFLLAPFVTLPFGSVVDIFRWSLLILAACSVPLWMYSIRLRPRWQIVLSAMLLVTASSPAVAEYFQQNLAALVVFFMAAAMAAMVRKWLLLGGCLLALATTKPDISGLMVLWVLLWVFGDWSERKRLVYGFGASMAGLLTAAQLVSPGWIPRFLAAVRDYPRYGANGSILHVLLPSFLASVSTAALLVLLLFVWVRWRRAAAGSKQFGWTLACVSIVTLTVIPKLAAYNRVLLVPALLMLASDYREILGLGLLPRAMTKGAFVCQIWQWLSAVILSASSLLLPVERLRALAYVPDLTSLAVLPMTLLAVLSCLFSLHNRINRRAT
jgi:hypothetical protein